MRNYIKYFLVLALGILVPLTGCGKKETPVPKPAPVDAAVIDMEKAFQAHPHYAAYRALLKQMEALKLQAQAEQEKALESQQNLPAGADGYEQALQQMDESLGKEYTAKMNARQAQYKARMEAKHQELVQQAQTEMQVYQQALDEEYKQQLFNIQLKLSTLALNQDEQKKLLDQQAAIHQEQNSKLQAKQEELSGQIQAAMQQEEKSILKDQEQYVAQLHADLTKKQKEREADMTARIKALTPEDDLPSFGDDRPHSALEHQLALKQQELSVMRTGIMDDIKNAAGKVAAQKGITCVMVDYKVNLKLQDLTDEVIKELKR